MADDKLKVLKLGTRQDRERLWQGIGDDAWRQAKGKDGCHQHGVHRAGCGAGRRRPAVGRIVEIYGPESSGKTRLQSIP